MTEKRTITEDAGGFQRQAAFFWTMLALCVLDVILLIWILHPFRLTSKTSLEPARLAIGIAQSGPSAVNAKKPSPLGKVAGSRAASHYPVSYAADANRRPRLVPTTYSVAQND